jgi:hypothetical protein
MDHERAETVLRRFAEAQLRRTPGEGRAEGAGWLVATVGNALVRTGALDAGVAGAIEDDVDLAMIIREPPAQRRGMASMLRQRANRPVPRYQAAVPAGSPPPRPAPDRMVPLDLPISLRSGEDRCVMHLLAFFQGGAGAWFPVYLRQAGPSPLTFRPRDYLDLLRGLSMADDTGASYRLTLRRASGRDQEGVHGELDITPPPSPEIRWVEIAQPGEPPVRVSLIAASPAADVMVTQVRRSPGEFLLHTVAARLLGRATLPHPDVLGGLVAVLAAVGVLSPDSPVPGQLARLCELRGIGGHDITAPPARDEDLPEQWRTAAFGHLVPHPRNRFAAATIALPDLDGVSLTILGLANSVSKTTLHIDIAGASVSRRDDSVPLLWLRDERDGWHSTQPLGWMGTQLSGWMSGSTEWRAQLAVLPPLNRAGVVEVLACGQSAEVRATLPLIWR